MSSIDHNLSDIFNARDLSAGDIATGFIPPPSFTRLLSQAHCILEGPRGSGKTTLLRMLTPESFAQWNLAAQCEPIQFIGVFVPADIRWAKQLTSRLSRISEPLAADSIQQSVFSVAVSLALIETLETCSRLAPAYQKTLPSLFFSISREKQAEVVLSLAELWQIDLRVPSFNSLRLALRTRQQEIGAIALRLATGLALESAQQQFPYIASMWLDNIVNAVETLNDVLERPSQLWAVLLDELEIIPKHLLRSIVEALRSTSPKLRFKLALSPTGSDLIAVDDVGAPSPTNDYRPVTLWYEGRDEARGFAEKLFESAINRLIPESFGVPLPKLLTSSREWRMDDVETITDETQTAQDSSKKERINSFLSLYQKDESFKILLDSKKIDPRDPHISDSSEVGTLVRKITPLVAFRDREIERFLLSEGRAVKKGARRGFEPYLGYPNLIDLTEGNPRWILTLAESLVAESKSKEHPLSARSVQAKAVHDFVEQFVAKLQVYPTTISGTRLKTTPFGFIKMLGESISSALYEGSFKSDPALSFTIDQLAMDQYGEYIRTCIDLGALVIMRRESTAPLGENERGLTLVGSRVRITYRLAPKFRLPLRSEKERKISNALKGGELLEPTSSNEESPEEFTPQLPVQGSLL